VPEISWNGVRLVFIYIGYEGGIGIMRASCGGAIKVREKINIGSLHVK